MNPNDSLAALNLTISVGMLLWGALFIWVLCTQRPEGRMRRIFVGVMAAIYILLMLDYGTTGTLRVIDVVAFPNVPHSLLPDFRLFPLGITLLLIWRSILAGVVWGLLFYVVVIKRGIED